MAVTSDIYSVEVKVKDYPKFNYFSNEYNKNLIEKLRSYGLNFDYLGKKIKQDPYFSGNTFVLTGSLQLYTRDEASEIIESLGGKTSSSVSKKTKAVIVGSDPGSKYTKAKELGIEILSEEEFKEKISSR